MSTNQWKPGDVVTLKSGSPEMTVVSVEPSTVRLQWFEGFDVKTMNTHPDALQKADG
jgi:uncharacterized protein YodC (DUF2158 family)